MEIKKNWNTLVLLLIAFVMYKAVDNHKYFLERLSFFFGLISPFLWAFCIAYLLNPLMTLIQKMDKKVGRFGAAALIYIVFIGIITILLTVITPVIVRNITEIIENLPRYIREAETFITDNIQKLEILDRVGATEYIDNNLENIFNKMLSFMNLTLSGVISSIIGITSGVAKMILAVMISFYMLMDKERFAHGVKRTIHAFFGKEKAEKFIDFAAEVDEVFKNFLVGKLIDSTIIGILCYIGMSLLKVRFSVLISIIIGVTNMIPYFGPFIGAVPAIIITLFIDPVQAIWVSLFILALQQFDGLILGPKILGDKVGVSPFYIMLAIVVGGGFFGPMGMLLGVPVLKSLMILWDRLMKDMLRKKGITMESPDQIEQIKEG
ncbi:MAG: AI-2E family transporter [Peptostreptococcaceae bacterium]|nr:AI-2E family transporter [Peptostreptococcaceae bacterium]